MSNITSLNTKNVRPQGGAQSAERQPQGTVLSEFSNQRAASAAAPAPAERKVDEARTEALAKELNKALAHIDSNYSVSVDGDTGMVVVRITDTETGEIVKQVPPQQVLDVSMSVEKIIGLLVNDQA